ncbi:hypothetical protein HZY97_19285 [Sphingomonas sp. R-74633]|uniref:hypothetical protein n=1 Tax=Sphingomonas sp. R-74633 TaxID=2751188 RepID=UPI0015D3C476|nr:hypothetical protein [Sphingomonas sp. R-74633]NYT42926.1 hypothetical protein [Sphingomonas sp. R-74633]
MRGLILFAAIAAAPPAWAQSKQEAPAPTILVTGKPIAETEKNLADCLARHCPPKEDIDATLAHAENQYLAGDYLAARRTVAESHHRNARFAKEYPVDVSDLQRAYGRLNDIIGLPDNGRLLQIFSFETLRDGLGSTNDRVLNQQLMTGDYFLNVGRLNGAMDVYRAVERKAHDAGQYQVEGRAMLRQAGTYATLAIRDDGYNAIARAKIAKMEKTTEPQLATYRLAAAVLRARLAAARGDEESLEKAVAALAGKGIDTPIAIYAPPLIPKDPRTGLTTHNEAEWFDLRYRIDAAGRVQDVERLRSSGPLSGDWAKQVEESIARRRYVPIDLGSNSDGMVRIERFSLVFDVTSGETGTHMRGRSKTGRIVTLDITPDDDAKTAAK